MLAESLVLNEFIADLFPQSSLLPSDPVLRARARLFIDQFNKLSDNFWGVYARGEIDGLLPSIIKLQEVLPAEGKGPYAVGDAYTVADIAISPRIGMLLFALENDLGAFAEGEGRKTFDTIQTDAQYASFKRYTDAIRNRESFKKVVNLVCVTVFGSILSRSDWQGVTGGLQGVVYPGTYSSSRWEGTHLIVAR